MQNILISLAKEQMCPALDSLHLDGLSMFMCHVGGVKSITHTIIQGESVNDGDLKSLCVIYPRIFYPSRGMHWIAIKKWLTEHCALKAKMCIDRTTWHREYMPHIFLTLRWENNHWITMENASLASLTHKKGGNMGKILRGMIHHRPSTPGYELQCGTATELSNRCRSFPGNF